LFCARKKEVLSRKGPLKDERVYAKNAKKYNVFIFNLFFLQKTNLLIFIDLIAISIYYVKRDKP